MLTQNSVKRTIARYEHKKCCGKALCWEESFIYSGEIHLLFVERNIFAVAFRLINNVLI